MTPIDELALRLDIGARAIREGRVEATVADLVEGALESIRAEAVARRGGGARVEVMRAWRERGLCHFCGRAKPAPGYQLCSRCLRAVRAGVARRDATRGGGVSGQQVC